MIHLRKLLKEHPDKASFQGEFFSWEYAWAAFTIYLDAKTGKWTGVATYNEEADPAGFGYDSTDKELSKILRDNEFANDKKESGGFGSNLNTHPSLLYSLGNMGRLKKPVNDLEFRSKRPDIPINARMWESGELNKDRKSVFLVSFWSTELGSKKFIKEIEDTIKLCKVDPKNCLYEFIDKQRKWITYEQFVSGSPATEKTPENIINKLLKIQHVNPKAKEALKQIQGMSVNKLTKLADKMGMPLIKLKQMLGKEVAENRLNESTDEIVTPDGQTFHYNDSKAVSVITIGKFETPSGMERGWLVSVDRDDVFYNGKQLDNDYPGGVNIHTELKGVAAENDIHIPVSSFNKTINGRLYIINNKYYLPFWENKKVILPFKKELLDYLDWMDINPVDILYQPRPLDNDQWMAYEEFFGELPSKAKGDEKKFELQKQLHLLSPEKKNKLLKKMGATSIDKLGKVADSMGMSKIKLRQLLGRDIAETKKLNEVPDEIEVDGKYYDYVDRSVEYVISAGEYLLEKENKKEIGWLSAIPSQRKLFFNGKFITSGLPAGSDTHWELVENATYFGIVSYYNETGPIEPPSSGESMNQSAWMNQSDKEFFRARSYKINEKIYISFWNDKEDIIKHKIVLFDFMRWAQYDPKEAMYQVEPMEKDEWIDYNTLFGADKIQTKGKKENWDFRQKLHLMPPDQKAKFLKKLGAMKPNKLQKAADKLGMTSIELKQLLGKDVAENSLGNLSYSDYNDPSIPYEAKPRNNIGFHYGTVFEYFMRKTKK